MTDNREALRIEYRGGLARCARTSLRAWPKQRRPRAHLEPFFVLLMLRVLLSEVTTRWKRGGVAPWYEVCYAEPSSAFSFFVYNRSSRFFGLWRRGEEAGITVTVVAVLFGDEARV